MKKKLFIIFSFIVQVGVALIAAPPAQAVYSNCNIATYGNIATTFTPSPSVFYENEANSLKIDLTRLTSGVSYEIGIYNNNGALPDLFSGQAEPTKTFTASSTSHSITFDGDGVKVVGDRIVFLNVPNAGASEKWCELGRFSVLISNQTQCIFTVTPTVACAVSTADAATRTFTLTATNIKHRGVVPTDQLFFEFGDGVNSYENFTGDSHTTTHEYVGLGTYTPRIYIMVMTGAGVPAPEEICKADPSIRIVNDATACSQAPPPAAGATQTTFELCKGPDGDACHTCQATDGVWTAIGCIPTKPTWFAAEVVRIIFGISGGLGFLLILYGAFLCITSQGNPQKAQACKETITSAVVGILMVIFSLLIIRVLFGPTGIIPGFVTIF